MWRKITSRGIQLLGGLIVLGPMILGTSPLPPPYHHFLLSGEVQRSSLGPRQSFLVTLIGKFSQPDTTVELQLGFLHPSNSYFDVTDTAGYFHLDLKAVMKPESLAVKISAVDKLDYIDQFFFVPEASVTIWGHSSGTASGCSSCENPAVPASDYIVGYQYQLPYRTVTVPY